MPSMWISQWNHDILMISYLHIFFLCFTLILGVVSRALSSSSVFITVFLFQIFMYFSWILWKWTMPTLSLDLWDVWWCYWGSLFDLLISTCTAEQQVPGIVSGWLLHGARCVYTLSAHVSEVCVPHQLYFLHLWLTSPEWRLSSYMCRWVSFHAVSYYP